MNKELLLVDFENVQQVDLSHVGAATRVVIFLGGNQKSVPIELVTAAQSLGERVEWMRIEGTGNNSLDFHIACYLGRMLEKQPGSVCVVLSKDKGFDRLVKYFNRSGLKCRRINSMLEQDPGPTDALNPQYKRVLEVLRKSEKKVAAPKAKDSSAAYIVDLSEKGFRR